MLPAQLDSIDEGHLNALVADGVRESRSLEFKAKLVWGTESEKKEFLADVSAFANGAGGDLIWVRLFFVGGPRGFCEGHGESYLTRRRRVGRAARAAR